jgi:crotonobetainyl-CoA:carnitine CoA-transferase CaiB-like acyl-CoA transferase
MSATPLQGLKVLDLSKVLAGPLCAQYLGDMGAEVIKVESPDGDETRGWPPFHRRCRRHTHRAPSSSAPTATSAASRWTCASTPGRRWCSGWPTAADVVIESFGPGVAEAWGRRRDAARANPRLVCCASRATASVGPMREGKGYDVILQAFSGMLSITGERGGAPVRSPFSPVDQATGLHALAGILAC